MLKSLQVKNYALIKQLDLELNEGLTVITGETGAGKSILLGALKLILGDRADSKVLFEEMEKCVVEGLFDISKYELKLFFESRDLDYSNELIVRREILSSGKSRAFINDTPVLLNDLKDLSELLIEVHSQNDSLKFKSKAAQYDIIDAFGGILSERKVYESDYRAYKKAEAQLEELREKENQAKLDYDYFSFQLSELNEAQIKPGELKELEEKYSLATRSEEISKVISESTEALNSGQGPIQILSELHSAFSSLEDISTRYREISERLKSVHIELDDLRSEIESLDTQSDFDQESLTNVADRLDMLNRLMVKHRVQTEAELLEAHREIQEKVASVESIEDQIKQAEKTVVDLRNKLESQGKRLLEKRTKAIAGLEELIHAQLQKLKMGEAQIKFVLEPSELNTFGGDALSIEFKTNPGSPFEQLHKVASGGELARLMLTLRSIVAKNKALPTVIFDEIDTGVSGEVASRMGDVMHEMGKNMQVLAITHLPQVAGKGNSHLRVTKYSDKNDTASIIENISGEERITEIAKMLSGDQIGQSAIDAAQALIQPN